MMFLQLVLQVIGMEHLVAFRAAHIFVTGHVLHLSQIVAPEPKGNDTAPDLVRINNLGMELLQLRDHVPDPVADVSFAGIDPHRPG